MLVTPCNLTGLLIIQPQSFADARGLFMELYHEKRYQECGIESRFVQDNFSLSKRGVLRGLHFQNPDAQGKMVSVIRGEILDVAVDLRETSPTFGKSETFHLSSENKRQLFIPGGFAHGFLTLSEEALVLYKCTSLYNAKTDKTLLWNDPEVGIRWPIENPQLSEKDAAGKPLEYWRKAGLCYSSTPLPPA